MAKEENAVIETIDIAEITQHASKKGKKFWKAKTTDDEFYTIWKEDVKDRLVAGTNTVSVDVNDAGDMVFRNIIGIAGAPGGGAAAAPPVDGGGYLSEMGAPAAAAPAPAARPAARPAAAPSAATAPAPAQNPQQYSGMTPIQQTRAAGLQIAAYMVAAGVITTVEMVEMSERNVRYILNGAGEHKNSALPATDYVEK